MRVHHRFPPLPPLPPPPTAEPIQVSDDNNSSMATSPGWEGDPS